MSSDDEDCQIVDVVNHPNTTPILPPQKDGSRVIVMGKSLEPMETYLEYRLRIHSMLKNTVIKKIERHPSRPWQVLVTVGDR